MPVWHAKTSELQRQGKLRVLGVVQEQHPDRARLFLQWQRIDWTVLVDPLNLLGVEVVPIMLLVDEHGIVRHIGSPAEDPVPLLESFLGRSFEPPQTALPARPAGPGFGRLRRSANARGAAGWRELADARLLWGGPRRLGPAIAAYERAVELAPQDGATRFRLGVAYRTRFDSEHSEPGDFARAVAQWEQALRLDPNNYIWRRRIQQYGPRLGKPYPFYDWVERARVEIRARGERPVALAVEPRGAELAAPARGLPSAPTGSEPDPHGRIVRDPGKLVRVQATAVPPRLAAGRATRIHLELEPRREARAHWNNEVEGPVVWVEPPDGWQVDRQSIELDNPAARVGTVSEEVRRVEFEAASPPDARGAVELAAYVLYYVCEGRRGQCLYRRQDLRVPLVVTD